jgi:hypothetical protein
MRFTYSILTFALLVSGSGCTLFPVTGEVIDGTTVGYQVNFSGYTDEPNTLVTGYVLSDATNLDSPWTAIGTTFTGTTNLNTMTTVTPAVPQYLWSLTSSGLTSAEWPQGGLVHVKAQSATDGNTTPADLVSFTNDSFTCLSSVNAEGEPWEVTGQSCETRYDVTSITMVSPTNTPFQTNPTGISYLGFNFGEDGNPPSAGSDATTTYYGVISAPLTLANSTESPSFLSYYEQSSATDLVNVKYYNAGDLGIGRDMYCWSFQSTGSNIGRACYVTNYGRNGTAANSPPTFGLDPQTVISQVIAGLYPVATVAMVYNPGLTENQIQFMVYDGSGNRSNFAALDSGGLTAIANQTLSSNANINVPNNCLTCHGTSSGYSGSIVTGASFLPFDPAANPNAPTPNLVFQTSGPYQQSLMMPKIAQLNAHVYATSPSPAIQAFLNGAYGTTTGPTATSTFNDAYVPAGWSAPTGSILNGNDTASTQIYTELIKPFCRTCHLSNTQGLDWGTEAEFDPFAGTAWGLACDGSTTPMPNSQQEQSRFWASPARAHLANAYGLSGACTP